MHHGNRSPIMVIELSGGKNFRDLGGIKTADGRRVKEGLFIRGGHLSNLTDFDIGVLEKYCPKSVIDMRSDVEQLDLPDRLIPGSEYLKVPLFSAKTAGLTRERGSTLEEIAENCSSNEEYMRVIPDLAGIYKMMGHSEEPVAGLSTVMRTVIANATEGRATIYHCSAGKDRTGIVSLLILTELGVKYERIMRDYLLTNKFVMGEAKKYYKMLLRKTGSKQVARKLMDCFVARRRYMESFIGGITEQYGSIEGFVRDGLGIGDGEIQKFREAALY